MLTPLAAALPTRRRSADRRCRHPCRRHFSSFLYIERGERIDAAVLRTAMETAFGAVRYCRRLGLEGRL